MGFHKNSEEFVKPFGPPPTYLMYTPLMQLSTTLMGNAIYTLKLHAIFTLFSLNYFEKKFRLNDQE